MKSVSRLFCFAFFIAIVCLAGSPVLAGSARAGIRGQTRIYQPGFTTEITPGVWVGDGGFSYPTSRSFTVLSARTRQTVTRVVSDASGQFQVALAPGKYLLVPDDSTGLKSDSGTMCVVVRALRMTEVTLYWEPVPVSGSSWTTIQPIGITR